MLSPSSRGATSLNDGSAAQATLPRRTIAIYADPLNRQGQESPYGNNRCACCGDLRERLPPRLQIDYSGRFANPAHAVGAGAQRGQLIVQVELTTSSAYVLARRTGTFM